MLNIGSHLSSSKGFLAMAKEAARIGASNCQFFLRNPRGGRAKELNLEDAAAFRAYAAEHGLGPFLAHASYVLNPATVDAKLQTFVRETVADDLARMEHLPGNMYNIHPGSHGGRGAEAGVAAVTETLDAVIPAKGKTAFLLETMSGGGSELGGTFEELKMIIDASERKKLLGVCLDTCHVFTAGYDIAGDLDAVLTRFDSIVGLDRLKAIHLNDSMFELGTHKDRHAKIGEGKIGLEAFVRIINHPALRDLPFYLETPNDPDGWGKEIALLRSRYGERGTKSASNAKPAAARKPKSPQTQKKKGKA